MTDVIDRACELEQQQLEQALAAAKPQAEQPQEFNGHRYCLVCDIELSTKRLIAHADAVRCVDCQHLHEHQQKNFNQGRRC
jgi:RNA polymerase-binding transcription factor